MSDEVTGALGGGGGGLGSGPRAFATLPDRPPLREMNRGSTGQVEADMKGAASSIDGARSLNMRTQARRDALIVMSRARERGGRPATHWSGLDADTLHAITDLLLQAQGAKGEPLETPFNSEA